MKLYIYIEKQIDARPDFSITGSLHRRRELRAVQDGDAADTSTYRQNAFAILRIHRCTVPWEFIAARYPLMSTRGLHGCVQPRRALMICMALLR